MIQSANFVFPFTIFLCSPRKFRWNPVVFLETEGFFRTATPSSFFLLLLERPRKFPKLPAPRADVTVAGCAQTHGFVLPFRHSVQNLSILPFRMFWVKRLLPSAARSVLATFSKLPHGGATSGFQALGGYALGYVQKTAQTADTGATGCGWRFGCAFNLYFQ